MNEPIARLSARNPWSWYPVVASKDLKAGKVIPVVLNGGHFVVWRSESGRANAWSDRCPHRGMRLSFGATQKEELICPYHGWTFGTDGHCIRIPAHPGFEPSRAARTRLYPSIETSGYVWVCIGEPSSETPEAGSSWPTVRSMHLPVDVPEATAALFIVPLDANDADFAPIDINAINWSGAGAMSVILPNERIFSASLTKAGTLSAFCQGPRGTARYEIRFQPAAHDACVVHLASASDPVAMNRALVAFRHMLLHQIDAKKLSAVRAALAERLPDQVSN